MLAVARSPQEVTMSNYQPHPFHWVPAEGQRHASTDERPSGSSIYPDGIEVTTLCEQTVMASTGEMAWLWPTCPGCNAAARARAGLPPMAGAR
ncbi:zinc finger protein [Saccharopolyspora oryzae]